MTIFPPIKHFRRMLSAHHNNLWTPPPSKNKSFQSNMESLKESMCCCFCQCNNDKKMFKTKKSSSEVAEFLQNITIGLLMVLFIIQAYRAWDKYSEKDTMMVSKILEPDSRVFPGVTICKGMLPGKYNGSIEEGYEFNAKLDNWLTAADFQNKTMNLSSSSSWTFRNASKHLFGDTLPPGFNCHTFTSPGEVSPGMQKGLVLHMAVNDYDFMFLVLHDSLQNIPVVDDIFGNTVMSISAPVDKTTQQIKDMAVDTTWTMRLGTKDVPCKDKRGNPTAPGLQECLENSFQEDAKCILPWNYNDDIATKRSCNDTDLVDFENFMTCIIEKPTFSNVYSKTKCIHPCEQITYTYKVPFELVIPKQKGYNVNIRIYLKPSGVTHKKEVVVFDALEMIGNVGGYLGLLLGWSVLSIFNTGCNKVMKLE